MSLRTLMQVGPAKVNELFAKLSETSDGTAWRLGVRASRW
jgi:hypothetical protein